MAITSKGKRKRRLTSEDVCYEEEVVTKQDVHQPNQIKPNPTPHGLGFLVLRPVVFVSHHQRESEIHPLGANKRRRGLLPTRGRQQHPGATRAGPSPHHNLLVAHDHHARHESYRQLLDADQQRGSSRLALAACRLVSIEHAVRFAQELARVAGHEAAGVVRPPRGGGGVLAPPPRRRGGAAAALPRRRALLPLHAPPPASPRRRASDPASSPQQPHHSLLHLLPVRTRAAQQGRRVPRRRRAPVRAHGALHRAPRAPPGQPIRRRRRVPAQPARRRRIQALSPRARRAARGGEHRRRARVPAGARRGDPGERAGAHGRQLAQRHPGPASVLPAGGRLPGPHPRPRVPVQLHLRRRPSHPCRRLLGGAAQPHRPPPPGHRQHHRLHRSGGLPLRRPERPPRLREPARHRRRALPPLHAPSPRRSRVPRPQLRGGVPGAARLRGRRRHGAPPPVLRAQRPVLHVPADGRIRRARGVAVQHRPAQRRQVPAVPPPSVPRRVRGAERRRARERVELDGAPERHGVGALRRVRAVGGWVGEGVRRGRRR